MRTALLAAVVFASIDARAEASEALRVRFGFNLGGGYLAGPTGGPAVDVTLRLGAQFNRLFGVLLQLQPNLLFADRESALGTAYGANAAALAELTLFDHLQLSLGPSLDALVEGGCAMAACASAPTLRLSGHARAAFVIGGRNPSSGRRSGVSISLNLHPLFRPNGAVLWLTTVGLGADWY